MKPLLEGSLRRLKGERKRVDLARSSQSEGSARAVKDVLKAAHFAAKKHAGQRRKGAAAEPYINHLLEVAELVASALAEPDANLVIAALLHDTVEDAGITKEELVQAFGPDVATLVMEVTDDKSLPKAERKRLQILTAGRVHPTPCHHERICSEPPAGLLNSWQVLLPIVAFPLCVVFPWSSV